jgi:hypothetical protein
MEKYVPSWYSGHETITHVSYLGGGKKHGLKFAMFAILSGLRHDYMPMYYSRRDI